MLAPTASLFVADCSIAAGEMTVYEIQNFSFSTWWAKDEREGLPVLLESRRAVLRKLLQKIGIDHFIYCFHDRYHGNCEIRCLTSCADNSIPAEPYTFLYEEDCCIPEYYQGAKQVIFIVTPPMVASKAMQRLWMRQYCPEIAPPFLLINRQELTLHALDSEILNFLRTHVGRAFVLKDFGSVGTGNTFFSADNNAELILDQIKKIQQHNK